VYGTYCVACHQANGQGIPPAFPAIAGSPIATGPIEGHMDIVLHGKPGTAMQAFGAQLNDVDLAAVITYQRNAFGNDKGDLVQPKQIKASR
jgi:cytochrome c oxidase subunit 2